MLRIRTNRSKKTFDCVVSKREAQARIYRDIHDMTVPEQIAYFDRKVRTGPLAGLWLRLEKGRRQATLSGKVKR
jgi:ribosomal protein L20